MIKICIIGLGYVGLPLALTFSKKFETIGFDNNNVRIKNLKNKIDNNSEFSKKDFYDKNINFTSTIEETKNCNYYIICVPTPVDKKNNPDLSPLKKAFDFLQKIIKVGDTVVLESTVYPGITNHFGDFLQKKTSLIKNKDFFMCYSPERINPGDNTKELHKINKIFSTEIKNKNKINEIKKIYKLASKKIIFSQKIEEAEAAKVIENIQRDLNIALFNEILMICDKLKINFNQVIKLAATKWNFINFKPGLVGGHCLPVDPYYLAHISRKKKLKIITTLSGRKTNSYMKDFVLKKFNEISKKKNIKLNHKILIIGLTYKYGVADMRNSLNFQIFKKIQKKYPHTKGYDPFIKNQKNIIQSKDISKYDFFVFLSDGNKYKGIFNKLKKTKKNIIDPFCYYTNK